MSSGTARSWDEARLLAEQLRERLAPSCERIEIAGSIRRRRPEVRDIELVAIPRMAEAEGGDLWGTKIEVDALEATLGFYRISGEIELRDVENHRADGSVQISQRDGTAYKALLYEGMPVDLFIVRPLADWGVILAIRTGPAEWSHRIVTDCQRYLRRVAGGRLYRSGQWVPCPEEADFFRGVGQEWVEPWERTAERVRIQAAVVA